MGRYDASFRRAAGAALLTAALLGGLACFRRVTGGRSVAGLVDRILYGSISGSALTGGGSPSSGVTNALSSASFKTVAAVGLIADDRKATASFSVREGYIPILMTGRVPPYVRKPGAAEPEAGRESPVLPAGAAPARFPEERLVAAAATDTREGPGAAFRAGLRLYAGTPVLVTAEAGGWARITSPVEGYVAAADLSREPR